MVGLSRYRLLQCTVDIILIGSVVILTGTFFTESNNETSAAQPDAVIVDNENLYIESIES